MSTINRRRHETPIIRRLSLLSLLLSTLNPSVSDFPRPVPLLDQSLEDTSLVPVTGGFEAEIRYKFNVQGFLNLTPVLSENGSMITGQMITSTIAVDAKTGAVIWSIGPSGSPSLSSSFVENPVGLKETDANMETKIIGGQQLTITSKDYTFTGHSMLSGSDSFGAPSILGLEDEIDSRRSGYCRSSVLVFRIRDGGHSGSSSVVDSVDSLPGDVILSLPPVEYPPLPPPKDMSLL
ncbi:hypothetical protein AKJ16_DCAP27649, partial [Drosera capensis]